MPRKVHPVTDDGYEPAEITELGPNKTVVASSKHAGGRNPDESWDNAKRYVESHIAREGRLARNKKGEPIRARAVEHIDRYFRDNEPEPWPGKPDIYRWLRNHPEKWQGWF